LRKKKKTFQKISDTGKVQKCARKNIFMHLEKKFTHQKRKKKTFQKISDTRKSTEVQASSTSWYRGKKILLEKVKKNKKRLT